MPDPSLYLFDGYNVLRAAAFDDRQELVDALASFVAMRGARGVVVFDGEGPETRYGALEVRFASDADALIERLAAEHREGELVCIVSSDAAIRTTSGQEVATISSRLFAPELTRSSHAETTPSRVADRLDEQTLAELERLRRGDR